MYQTKLLFLLPIEGVHQDGQEFVMTTLLKTRNIDWKAGSCKTRVLRLEEPLNTHHNNVNPKNIIQDIQHRNYLDSIIWVDTSFKHVVSDIHAFDDTQPAHRDIIVSFTRRLADKNGKSPMVPFDTETSHETLPRAFGMKSKHLPH